MVNAGLHAHNQLLEASELEHLCTDSQQVDNFIVVCLGAPEVISLHPWSINTLLVFTWLGLTQHPFAAGKRSLQTGDIAVPLAHQGSVLFI